MPSSEEREVIEATIAGAIQMSTLSAEMQRAVNVEIDARIREAVLAIDVGAALRRQGLPIITMSDQSNLVTHHPDGSVSVETRLGPGRPDLEL